METLWPETLIPLLAQNAILLLWALPGLIIFGALANRAIFIRPATARPVMFDRVDAAIAFALTVFLTGLVISASAASADGARTHALPSTRAMIGGVFASEVFFVGVLAILLVGMVLRGKALLPAFGLEAARFPISLAYALGLLFLAFPLIAIALELSRVLLASFGYLDVGPQEMVRFLAKNHSATGRAVVAISAVVLAPIQEELIFRGYLYGVARRYAGPLVGMIFTSLLFAAIHMHLPSFGGLFVLAMCLTLAYEWTGSLYVSIAMHAMFNSIAVINLLAGGAPN